MSSRLFGTDGIRGPFGEPPLDRETVERLGYRVGEVLAANGHEPRIVVGGDTRASTPTLASWLATGLDAAGASSSYAGVLPTPGVAALTRHLGAQAGVAISASHNPHPDNGIKLFGADGFKWDDAAEDDLEQRLAAPAALELDSVLEPEIDASLARFYLEHLERSLPEGTPLDGLGVALDCANGAASPFARQLFEDLGADVVVIGDRPNGENINLDCGSTRPERLIELVRERRADLGVAFDGDADRAVLVDETGALQDGDSVLYLWARELQRQGRLEPAAVVATTMSNLGLEHALARLEIDVVRCDVGDRAVVETMRRDGILLGGEQSGHIIHLGFGSTGDGLLTAVQMAALVARADRPLSELAAPVERFPQILVNVPVGSKPPFETVPSIVERARAVEERLGRDGRLLLRYSGTEPLARVMIEGRDQQEIEALANELAQEIGASLGG